MEELKDNSERLLLMQNDIIPNNDLYIYIYITSVKCKQKDITRFCDKKDPFTAMKNSEFIKHLKSWK